MEPFVSPELSVYVEDYLLSHRNPWNLKLHHFAVPTFLVSGLALLSFITLADPLHHPVFKIDVALIAEMGLGVFWFRLAGKFGLLALLFYGFLSGWVRLLPLQIILSLTVLAYVLQVIGHAAIERRQVSRVGGIACLSFGALFHFLRSTKIIALSCTFFALLQTGCTPKKLQPEFSPFQGQRAYQDVETYTQFGPKVSGTDNHKKVADWIVTSLKSSGATVIEHTASATTFTQKKIPIRNLIAQFNPDHKKRILLSAHYDSRDIADEDKKRKNEPILAANDGGSGVGMLLEFARSVQPQTLPYGLDLIFWDAEDLGRPGDPYSYCLGSQAFAKNPKPAGYKAAWGINFDMVGRKGTVFGIEKFSEAYAPDLIKRIWDAAKAVGANSIFGSHRFGPVVDDPVFITKGLGIPMVNLIAMGPDGKFPPEWHTHDDTMKVISKDVLQALGDTVLHVLKNEPN